MIKDNGVIFQNRFRENNCQLRILHPAKLSHSREGKIKTFQANNELTAHKNPHGKKSKTTYHPGRRKCNPERNPM